MLYYSISVSFQLKHQTIIPITITITITIKSKHIAQHTHIRDAIAPAGRLFELPLTSKPIERFPPFRDLVVKVLYQSGEDRKLIRYLFVVLLNTDITDTTLRYRPAR